MAFKDNAFGLRMCIDESFKIETKLETGAAPWQPADFIAKNLRRQFSGIFGRSDGDDGIGMHVIHMPESDKSVQRRIDGSCARIEVEGAVRQKADHAVFILDALIDAFQRIELILIERGKTVELDGADITARPLDPENLHLLTGQRIGFLHLGGSVSAAIIGDALVRTEQIGAVKQLARLIHRCRLGVIPPVFEKPALGHHVILPILLW